MAFANLFMTLTAADEDVPVPLKSSFPYRKGAQVATKRQNLGEQLTVNKKEDTRRKHFNQAKSKSCRPPKFYDNPANNDNPGVTPYIDQRSVYKEEDLFNHSSTVFQNDTNEKVQHKNTPNVKQRVQQQEVRRNNKKKKKKHHQGINGGSADKRQCHQANHRKSFPSKGKGSNKEYMMQSPPVKRQRFMTQEFKDRNAQEVDGRLLCLHFLRGRCNKGDECQLEHAEIVNDLIKEVCKFYIQGSCLKENCAYMHKSFPCKFFHTRGNCYQGADCRFSHEPLTDLTKQLLDKALKRDQDLIEMTRKSQQVTLGQPGSADAVVTSEEGLSNSDPKPDILSFPIRPNFYNSSCPSEQLGETATFPSQTGEMDAAQDPVPIHTDAPLSKPVSYSVEAMLGPIHSKPFPSLFGTSADKVSTISSSPQCTFEGTSNTGSSNNANQGEAPYTIDAVLGSVKTVGSLYFTHSSSQPLSSNSPLTHIPKLSASKPDAIESTEAKRGLMPSSDVPPLNLDHSEKTNSHLQTYIIASQVPWQSTEVSETVIVSKSKNNSVLPLQPDTEPDKDNPKAFQNLFACPLSQSVFKNPPHVKSHLPAMQLSPKPRVESPNTSLTRCQTHKSPPGQRSEFKCGHSEVLSGAEASPMPSVHTQPAKEHCKSKRAHCGEFVVGRCKPVKRQPHNSSAIPVTDSDDNLPHIQITADSIPASSGSQEAARCSFLSVAETGRATRGVLHSLFTTPINETTAPLPPAQGDHGTRENLLVDGDSRNHTKNSCAVGFPSPSLSPKRPKRKKCRPQQKLHQIVTDPISTLHFSRRLPEISLDKDSSNATTSNSVLKTLFLSLRPYSQEEQQHFTQKNKNEDKERRSHRSTFRKEEKMIMEEMKKKVVLGVKPARHLVTPEHQAQRYCKLTNQLPVAAPTIAKHQPSVQNLRCLAEASDVRTSGSLTQVSQVGADGTQHPPIGSKMQMRMPCNPPTKQPSPAQSSRNGKLGGTLLKNLFKTLDPAASPFGH